MASTIKIITTPISYLAIKQPQKNWFDFILPFILSLITTAIILFVDLKIKNIELFVSNGIVNVINGITQILSGFYIASMAAIATFPNKELDKFMQGITPKYNGKRLTRRNFLIRLFGYLSFICIVLYFYGGISVYFSTFIVIEKYSELIKSIFCLTYFSVFFNMLLTTSLGLSFMISKLCESENDFIPPKK